MRRGIAALGVAIVCLVFTIGASSSDAVAVFPGADAPKLLEPAAVVTPPTATAAPSSRVPAPAFGSYAVIALESLLAATLVCYAFLQRRRSEQACGRVSVVRLRGPPRVRAAVLAS
jgi:hypothetical protein